MRSQALFIALAHLDNICDDQCKNVAVLTEEACQLTPGVTSLCVQTGLL
jgi:hypothetical protein